MFKVFSFLLIACTIAFCSVKAQDCYNTKRVKIHYLGIQDKAVWSLTVERLSPYDSLNDDSLQRVRNVFSFDKHIYVDSISFCLFVDYINKQKSDDSITDRDGFEILSTMRNGNSLSKLLGGYRGLINKYLSESIQLLKREKASSLLISELESMYRRINY